MLRRDLPLIRRARREQHPAITNPNNSQLESFADVSEVSAVLHVLGVGLCACVRKERGVAYICTNSCPCVNARHPSLTQKQPFISSPLDTQPGHTQRITPQLVSPGSLAPTDVCGDASWAGGVAIHRALV